MKKTDMLLREDHQEIDRLTQLFSGIKNEAQEFINQFNDILPDHQCIREETQFFEALKNPEGYFIDSVKSTISETNYGPYKIDKDKVIETLQLPSTEQVKKTSNSILFASKGLAKPEDILMIKRGRVDLKSVAVAEIIDNKCRLYANDKIELELYKRLMNFKKEFIELKAFHKQNFNYDIFTNQTFHLGLIFEQGANAVDLNMIWFNECIRDRKH